MKGYSIPELTLQRDNEMLSMQSVKGKYLLLSFWSSTDAQSRLACNQYDAYAKSFGEAGNLCLVSVNFDCSEGLFKETVRRDNLAAETQFNVKDEKAERIKKDFHLEKGFRSILVDTAGIVIATNPDRAALERILNQ